MSFGEPVAEEESSQLTNYFVETDQWRKLSNGQIDVIYGPKGSGKSALYWLLSSKEDYLFDQGILTITAENPRGAAAFSGLVEDPPTSETEFVNLWKLYFLCLTGPLLKEYFPHSKHAKSVVKVLTDVGLLDLDSGLKKLVKRCLDYVRTIHAEPEVGLDESTGMPNNFKLKIYFSEPTAAQSKRGAISIDDLLQSANLALKEEGYSSWILIDRLDVAFSTSKQLEENALRALFRVYNDLKAYENIKPKIFLRDDIWQRITADGFREATHITKKVVIKWDKDSLLNLVIRRLIQNERFCSIYRVDQKSVLSSYEQQEELFYRVYPEQVEVGPRKSKTFDWMIGRTRDGSQDTAPREVIQLLKYTLQNQIEMLERGEQDITGEELFSRLAIKKSVSLVSKDRLELTLWAEYPHIAPFTKKLEREKTLQDLDSLSAIWDKSLEETETIARELVEIGFFELRGTKEKPQFWVPFLYRERLSMVQGTAPAFTAADADER
jgi:hypothetical protein